MPASLGSILHETTRTFPNKPAVIFAGEATSYERLESMTNAVSSCLRHNGIRKGDRIGLYCINSPEFVAAYYGIVHSGAVVVPINLLLAAEEIAYILANAEVRGLIFHEAYAKTVEKVAASVGSLSVRIVVGKPSINADIPFSDVLKEPTSNVAFPSVDANDLAAIMYTSGTTGKPKGAMLSHANLVANVSATQEAMKVTSDDVFLVVLPMFHSFAATVGMHLPIMAGATISAMLRFSPDDVGRTIEETNATIFLGVPSMYTILANLSEGRRADLSSLRIAVSGGSALPVEILNRFERIYGVPVHEGDGPTECGPVTTFNPVGRDRKPGTIGVPIPSVEMYIADPDGKPLSTGEIGEICVRGPSVMKGYLNDPNATAESFYEDWFRTGDMGFVDEDGYYSIVDRLKDMIIVNGINVYPRQIEEIIYRHPAVHEVAVVPEPDRLHGEVPRAVISLKPGQTSSEKEIVALCRQHLGRHQVPRIVDFVDELPKTASGKILKRELTQNRANNERGIE